MKHTELRQLRKSAKLTMVDVSRLFKVPYRTWQNWELGLTRVPPMAGVILELYRKSLAGADSEENNMSKVIVLTDVQAQALRDIIKPEYRQVGHPRHKINVMVVSALMDKGLIQLHSERSNRLIVTRKFRHYKYDLIKQEAVKWKI